MKRKKTTLHPIFMIMVWILVAATIIVSAILSQNEATQFEADSNIIKITEATVSGVGRVSAPYTVVVVPGEEIEIWVDLPATLKDGDGLCFTDGYCVAEVVIEGRTVYTYGKTAPLPYGSMLGNIRNVVPLGEEYAGRTAEIHLTSVYGMSWTMGDIFVGSISDIRYYILMGNLWRLLVITFFATLGLICVGIAIHHYIHGRRENGRQYLCLVSFILCVAVWLIASSDLPQFVTNANAVVSTISFLSLSLMTSSFMFYTYHVLDSGKPAFLWTGRICLLLPVINCVLYVTNVMDPVPLMFATHASFIGAITLAVVNSIRDMYSEKTKDGGLSTLLAIVFLAIAAFIALIFFYRNQMGIAPSVSLGIGFSFFSLGLFMSTLLKEEKLIGEQMTDNLYREMAFKDYLTGCGNRAAFELELEKGETNGNSRVTIVMLDLNRLKQTNDELGHQAGDEMICGIAGCIETAFAPKGHCYRLGGDEFASILWDCDFMMEDYIAKLMQTIEEYNREHIIQLSVAVGYANGENPKDRNAFNKIYSAADRNMYLNKMDCHRQMDGEE